MKILMIKIFPAILIFLSLNAFGQKEDRANAKVLQGKNFAAVDAYVRKLGSLDSMNMGTISNILTKNFADNIDKARAIFDWIAFNISYDLKAGKSGGSDKNSSTDVLLARKATGIGYANLFQDMCSSANIRCLVPDGYFKFSTDQINARKEDMNHRWAVVQLGPSPEAWFYVDPCLGAGYTDGEFKTFTKSFDPNYFFANLYVFNLQHYPDNLAWQLGQSEAKSKKDFFGLPLVKSAAYDYGLKRLLPSDGIVKIKVGKPLSFSYALTKKEGLKKVTLVITEGRKKQVKDIPLSFENEFLNFQYKFEEEGSYELTVLLDGKDFMQYLVEVE